MHARTLPAALVVASLFALSLSACSNFKATDKNLPARYQSVYNSQSQNYAVAARQSPVTRQTRIVEGEESSAAVSSTSAARRAPINDSDYTTQGLVPPVNTLSQNFAAIPAGTLTPSANGAREQGEAIELKKLRFDQVMLVQASLINEGYTIPALNGELDVQTLQALVKFQSKHNIQANGMMSRTTYELLGLHWEAA